MGNKSFSNVIKAQTDAIRSMAEQGKKQFKAITSAAEKTLRPEATATRTKTEPKQFSTQTVKPPSYATPTAIARADKQAIADRALTYTTPTQLNRMDAQATAPKSPVSPTVEVTKPQAPSYATPTAINRVDKQVAAPQSLPELAQIQQEKRKLAQEITEAVVPITVSEPETTTPRRPHTRTRMPTRHFLRRQSLGQGENIAYITQQLEHWTQVLDADKNLLGQYQARYDEDPTQERIEDLSRCLAKTKRDIENYNIYAIRYTNYYSSEAFQERIDALETELAEKQHEENPAQYWDPGRTSNSQRTKMDEAKKDAKILEAKIEEEKRGKRFVEYEALRTAPDFEAKSAYKPNRGKPVGKIQYMSGYDPELQMDTGLQIMDTGYEDVTYDSINGDQDARLIASQLEGGNYEDVPEDVVKMFNYLYEEEGRNAAYEYMDFMAQRQYSPLYAFSIGMADAMGATSASKAAAKGLAVLASEPEAADVFGTAADSFQAKMKHQHPVAYMAGGGFGAITLMKGIAKGLCAIPGFAKLPTTARAVLAGAGTMGGASAVQEAGDTLIGSKSWQEFTADVLMNSAAGGLGGGVSQKLGDAGLKLLKAKHWEGNTLARMAVAGTSGAGYSLASTAVREAYSYGKDPENYKLDTGQIALDAAVGFALAAIHFYAYNRGTTGEMAETDADDTLMKKYFKGMSKEEARTEYHRLAQEYSDVFNKTGELSTYTPEELARYQIVQEINAAWEQYNVVNGAEAYKRATTAQANGDATGYQQAAADFTDSVKDLQVITTAGEMSNPTITEALEILQSVSADMSNAVVSPKAEVPSSVDHVLALAQQADAAAQAEWKTPDWVPQAIRDGMKAVTDLNLAAAKRSALGDLLGYPREVQKNISLFLDKVLADAEDIARWEAMPPEIRQAFQPELDEKKESLQWLEERLAETEGPGGEQKQAEIASSVEKESELENKARHVGKGILSMGRPTGFEGLPQNLRHSFNDGLKTASPEIQVALRQWKRKVQYITSIGKRSFYRPEKQVVSIGRNGTSSTIAHELFHWVDEGGCISSQLLEPLMQDYVALKMASRESVKAYLIEHYPEAFVDGNVLQESPKMRPEYRGIADVLNGLSGGKEHYGYGHSEEYWGEPGHLEAEAWAQFGRYQYDNLDVVLKMFQELFPNFYKGAIIKLKELI